MLEYQNKYNKWRKGISTPWHSLKPRARRAARGGKNGSTSPSYCVVHNWRCALHSSQRLNNYHTPVGNTKPTHRERERGGKNVYNSHINSCNALPILLLALSVRMYVYINTRPEEEAQKMIMILLKKLIKIIFRGVKI